MKKFIITLCVALMGITTVFGLSRTAIRENARFLTDRMAYELDMTPRQYEDCYEINYDFITAVNPIMKDVAYGYSDAIDMYYTYLDYRNDDLHYIMTERQYRQFITMDYFYRPIYTYRGDWLFRVYQVYNNRKFFYFDAPTVYRTYAGTHSRTHHSNGYYGNGRYQHAVVPKYASIRQTEHYGAHSRTDFGQNRRDRQTRQSTNGYNNRNQDNRTQDRRYQDDRKGQNQNSPEINHRGNQGTQGTQGRGNNPSGTGSNGNRGNQGNGTQGNQSHGNGNQSHGSGTQSRGNGGQPQGGHGR